MTIPADKRKSQQSVTLTLPPSHSILHVVPYLPVALDGRAWRSFFVLNGKPGSEVSRMALTPSINGSTPTYEGVKKKGEPLYEAKLIPGVNRIEIEVIAEKKVKNPEARDVKDVVDIEKCVIFVNLLRPS